MSQKRQLINFQTSSVELRDRISDWFAQKSLARPIFPTILEPLDRGNQDTAMNVVLMGGFSIVIAQSLRWPEGQYRIWTLCQTAKATLVKLYGLPACSVGVIPRSDLIRSEVPVGPLSESRTVRWIFGGRISRTKNLPLLLATCSELQSQGWNLHLTIMGTPDRDRRDDLGQGLAKRALNLEHNISGLVWRHKPKILPAVTENQWRIELRKYNSYVSFSTQYMEDFGLGACEAIEAGKHCFLSRWGGHMDYPAQFVTLLDIPADEDFSSISKLSPVLVTRIARQISKKLCQTAHQAGAVGPCAEFAIPQTLSKSEIVEALVGSPGVPDELLLLPNRRSMRQFAMTIKGEQFFSEYRKIFLGRA